MSDNAKKARRLAPTTRSRPTRAEVLRVVGLVLGRVRRNPALPIRHLVALAREMGRVVRGRSAVAPSAGDRRFADGAWQSSRIRRILMQAYLCACQEAYALVRELELEGREASSARFVATTLLEAIAPSNNPFVNPVVIAAARKSRGRTLLRGFQNFLGDQLDNNGVISMVDRAAFEVGRNVAATPGEVVFRDPILELIQYRPTTSEVHSRPLLIVPPQINKFYVLDLSPQNSLVRYLVGKGFQVFMVSWRNPQPEHRDWGLADYCDSLEKAHLAVMAITGSPDVNLKGLCAGGLTSAVLLGRYATTGRLQTVNSLTLNVTLLDIEGMGHTNMGFFLVPDALEASRAQSRKEGVLQGHKLAKMFAWIRPNDLVWNYWVNNYLMGQKPAAFDVLFWNSDAARLPAALHSDFIDLVLANPFGKREGWKVGETKFDLREVTVEKFIVAGRTDHITPWDSCYRSVDALGGASQFVLVNSGHIQTLVSPPGKGKATYQVADETYTNAADWLAASRSVSGSWWDHWSAWLATRSGDLKPAPSILGDANHPGLGTAPGTYVLS